VAVRKKGIRLGGSPSSFVNRHLLPRGRAGWFSLGWTSARTHGRSGHPINDHLQTLVATVRDASALLRLVPQEDLRALRRHLRIQDRGS
jgi:hypothetical protein